METAPRFPFHAAVVGLGYVGLPLAVAICDSGSSVLGIDVDLRRAKRLGSGESDILDVPSTSLSRILDSGELEIAADFDALAQCEFVLVCVPTPLNPDHTPDMSYVVAAMTEIGRRLVGGQTVVLESTTWPGTTEDLVRPLLERESGLRAGVDFGIAYSPERVDPGNPDFGIANTPKIVGGSDESTGHRVAEFYRSFIGTVHLASGTREAEAAKILENLYRLVNIALINEFSVACRALNIDPFEVVELAATKPYGFQRFTPGPGVGGHCIPIDPLYFDHAFRQATGTSLRFVAVATEVNEFMPTYVGQLVQAGLNEAGLALKGSRILLLGVSYKPDIADVRETPAEPLALWLIQRGAVLTFHDPGINDWSLADGTSIGRAADLESSMQEADFVVALQPHSVYRGMSLSADVAAKTLTASSRMFSDATFRL